MICDIYTVQHGVERFANDPRYVAEKAEAYLRASGIADDYLIGPEFEFNIFDRVSFDNRPNCIAVTIDAAEAEWNTREAGNGYKSRYKAGYHLALPNDSSNDFRSQVCLLLEQAGLPVKYHHHEAGGVGQVEIEVELGPLRTMADRTFLLKYMVKNLASQQGKTATFMPKPLMGEAGQRHACAYAAAERG